MPIFFQKVLVRSNRTYAVSQQTVYFLSASLVLVFGADLWHVFLGHKAVALWWKLNNESSYVTGTRNSELRLRGGVVGSRDPRPGRTGLPLR